MKLVELMAALETARSSGAVADNSLVIVETLGSTPATVLSAVAHEASARAIQDRGVADVVLICGVDLAHPAVGTPSDDVRLTVDERMRHIESAYPTTTFNFFPLRHPQGFRVTLSHASGHDLKTAEAATFADAVRLLHAALLKDAFEEVAKARAFLDNLSGRSEEVAKARALLDKLSGRSAP